MWLKITYIYFLVLVVFCSAVQVNEGADYGNSDQHLRIRRSLQNNVDKKDLQITSTQLKRQERKDVSINQINREVTRLSNSNQEIIASIAEQKKLLRTVLDQMSAFQTQSCPDGHDTSSRFENMVSSCGGTLNGESGVISYKENENYRNRENCTWIIEAAEATKIVLNLEKSGLELAYDHVNVTSVDVAGIVQHPPLKLRPNRPVFVEGPKAMVRFSSNKDINGKGFRLTYHTIMELNSNDEEILDDDKCGGVIIGNNGQLSYKPDETYLNNERCIWLLNSPNSTNISFQLLKSGLERCCDFLYLSTIDPETGTLRNEIDLLGEPQDFAKVEDSMVIIIFSSDNSNNGSGFILKYSASGVNDSPNYIYKLDHKTEANGTIEYPTALNSQLSLAGADDDDGVSEQVIYVTAISATATTVDDDDEVDIHDFIVVDWNDGVFKQANGSSCIYDSFTIYEPIATQKEPGVALWELKAQFPFEELTLKCPDEFSIIETNSNNNNDLQFDTNSFLSVYKPVSGKMNEADVGFSFDYYLKSDTCGGDLLPLGDEFGIISYKENNYYANNEDCTWIIKVPDAKSIDFTLEKDGVEECCDYIIVSAVDEGYQLYGPQFRLSSGNPTASVKGPYAWAFFVSDETNIGSGFRLRYEKAAESSHNDKICGGTLSPLKGEFGLVVYKVNEYYANNENCTWIVKVPRATRISFILEQSGFEDCCDFVTVRSIGANGVERGEPAIMGYNNTTMSVKGPIAMVRFTSDKLTTGTGFRLRYEGLRLPDAAIKRKKNRRVSKF